MAGKWSSIDEYVDGKLVIHFSGYRTLVELWVGIDQYISSMQDGESIFEFEMGVPGKLNPWFDDGEKPEPLWQMLCSWGYS